MSQYPSLVPALLVAAGGALGALARFFLGDWIARKTGSAWPYGTLIINVSGCLALSLFVTLAAERLSLPEAWRYFFPIGFVGAYTTFSTFEHETLRLIEAGELRGALAYVALSNGLGLSLISYDSGEPQVRIRDPHPLTDMGKSRSPTPGSGPLASALFTYPSLHLRVRQSAQLEPPRDLECRPVGVTAPAGTSGLLRTPTKAT